MLWTDSHSHIYTDAFEADRSEVISRAVQAGIHRILMPNIDEASMPMVLEVADKYPGLCLPMIGLHPCDVKENWEEVFERMLQFESKAEWVAVGETGLDFYWDKTFVQEQELSLAAHVELANRLKLPLVLHARESLERLIALFSGPLKAEYELIFHCFGGTREQAEWIAERGYFMGIGGVLTYKKSTLEEVLEGINRSQVILETDAPYLPPVPHRGKRNEPYYMLETAAVLARVWGISMEELSEITEANIKRAFRIN